nr:hypothetical protein [Chitinophagaceae bacterium]
RYAFYSNCAYTPKAMLKLYWHSHAGVLHGSLAPTSANTSPLEPIAWRMHARPAPPPAQAAAGMGGSTSFDLPA